MDLANWALRTSPKFTTRVMCGLPSDVSEEPVPLEKRKKGWRMSCDVGEAAEGFENDL